MSKSEGDATADAVKAGDTLDEGTVVDSVGTADSHATETTGGESVFCGSSVSIGVTSTLLEFLSFLLEFTAGDEAPWWFPSISNFAELLSILDVLTLEERSVFFNKVEALDFLVLRSCPAFIFTVICSGSEAAASLFVVP